jgi:hypothetical protein
MFREYLPALAIELIDRETSVTGAAGHLQQVAKPEITKQAAWSAMVALAAFEAEMTYLLSDRQSSIRSRTERAFAHLRRSIVVDSSLRDKWLAAFKDHETACEKLGAVHLLLHGIWAFKAHGLKARTDLVFQEQIDNLADVQRSAAGLVLTEWKVYKTGAPERKFCEAREEARQYASGMLAGIELSAFRYAVVVSKAPVAEPKDLVEGPITWRHINIPLCPLTPSEAARRQR